jgi:hypothetical protein
LSPSGGNRPLTFVTVPPHFFGAAEQSRFRHPQMVEGQLAEIVWGGRTFGIADERMRGPGVRGG